MRRRLPEKLHRPTETDGFRSAAGDTRTDCEADRNPDRHADVPLDADNGFHWNYAHVRLHVLGPVTHAIDLERRRPQTYWIGSRLRKRRNPEFSSSKRNRHRKSSGRPKFAARESEAGKRICSKLFGHPENGWGWRFGTEACLIRRAKKSWPQDRRGLCRGDGESPEAP